MGDQLHHLLATLLCSRRTCTASATERVCGILLWFPNLTPGCLMAPPSSWSRLHSSASHPVQLPLYCKSRAARGRETFNLCSRGCSESETLNHILQKCCATHRLRINRHDQLCIYLSRSLLQRGYFVQQEPVFESPDESKLKPDLTDQQQASPEEKEVSYVAAPDADVTYHLGEDTVVNMSPEIYIN